MVGKSIFGFIPIGMIFQSCIIFGHRVVGEEYVEAIEMKVYYVLFCALLFLLLLFLLLLFLLFIFLRCSR